MECRAARWSQPRRWVESSPTVYQGATPEVLGIGESILGVFPGLISAQGALFLQGSSPCHLMDAPESAARVVIIEDHALVRELLVSLLRDEFQLTVAAQCTTCAEGIAACLRTRPRLVIVDWMLPDGRAFDIVRATSAQLPHTRWLLLTSNEQEHIVRDAVQLGMHGCVMKKSPLEIFCDAIRAVLAGHSFYCAQSSRLLVESLRSEAALGTNLTSREREVLRRVALGDNPKQIAEDLGITPKTVQNLLVGVKEKLSIQEPAGLVRYAIKHGLVEPP
jgi:DNA-binding NarL/FixJ family response regulator